MQAYSSLAGSTPTNLSGLWSTETPRQPLHRCSRVNTPELRVRVHCEVDVGMSRELLGGPYMNSGPGQQSYEGLPQSMEVGEMAGLILINAEFAFLSALTFGVVVGSGNPGCAGGDQIVLDHR